MWSSAAVNSENTLLFIGDDAGVLYCLNPADGAEYARYNTGGTIRATPALGTANGPEVFVTSGDGYLYCFDQDNLGSYKWRESIGQSAAIELHSSPVIAPNGWVFVGSNDGNLYAFDPTATPRLQWTFATGGRVEASPVIGKNGWVFFGSWDSYVYALDPAAPAATRLKWYAPPGTR